MARGPNGETRPGDVIGCAVKVAKIATGEVEDTRLEQPEKRKGGRRGGSGRAAGPSPERRTEIAQAAAAPRWGGED